MTIQHTSKKSTDTSRRVQPSVNSASSAHRMERPDTFFTAIPKLPWPSDVLELDVASKNTFNRFPALRELIAGSRELQEGQTGIFLEGLDKVLSLPPLPEILKLLFRQDLGSNRVRSQYDECDNYIGNVSAIAITTTKEALKLVSSYFDADRYFLTALDQKLGDGSKISLLTPGGLDSVVLQTSGGRVVGGFAQVLAVCTELANLCLLAEYVKSGSRRLHPDSIPAFSAISPSLFLSIHKEFRVLLRSIYQMEMVKKNVAVKLRTLHGFSTDRMPEQTAARLAIKELLIQISGECRASDLSQLDRFTCLPPNSSFKVSAKKLLEIADFTERELRAEENLVDPTIQSQFARDPLIPEKRFDRYYWGAATLDFKAFEYDLLEQYGSLYTFVSGTRQIRSNEKKVIVEFPDLLAEQISPAHFSAMITRLHDALSSHKRGASGKFINRAKNLPSIDFKELSRRLANDFMRTLIDADLIRSDEPHFTAAKRSRGGIELQGKPYLRSPAFDSTVFCTSEGWVVYDSVAFAISFFTDIYNAGEAIEQLKSFKKPPFHTITPIEFLQRTFDLEGGDEKYNQISLGLRALESKKREDINAPTARLAIREALWQQNGEIRNASKAYLTVKQYSDPTFTLTISGRELLEIAKDPALKTLPEIWVTPRREKSPSRDTGSRGEQLAAATAEKNPWNDYAGISLRNVSPLPPPLETFFAGWRALREDETAIAIPEIQQLVAFSLHHNALRSLLGRSNQNFPRTLEILASKIETSALLAVQEVRNLESKGGGFFVSQLVKLDEPLVIPDTLVFYPKSTPLEVFTTLDRKVAFESLAHLFAVTSLLRSLARSELGVTDTSLVLRQPILTSPLSELKKYLRGHSQPPAQDVALPLLSLDDEDRLALSPESAARAIQEALWLLTGSVNTMHLPMLKELQFSSPSGSTRISGAALLGSAKDLLKGLGATGTDRVIAHPNADAISIDSTN